MWRHDQPRQGVLRSSFTSLLGLYLIFNPIPDSSSTMRDGQNSLVYLPPLQVRREALPPCHYPGFLQLKILLIHCLSPPNRIATHTRPKLIVQLGEFFRCKNPSKVPAVVACDSHTHHTPIKRMSFSDGINANLIF
jgi:hypothetical protein